MPLRRSGTFPAVLRGVSTWTCPACAASVDDFLAACSCGFERDLEAPPSRLIDAPTRLYPWLGRALLLLHIGAYLSLAVGVLRSVDALVDWLAVPAGASATNIAASKAHFLAALLWLVAGGVGFVMQRGLVEAGLLLQAVHRRVTHVDERGRGGQRSK